MIKVSIQVIAPKEVDWIVDTGVFVARFVEPEPWHRAAYAFFARVHRRGETIEVPEIVIAEVLHVLLAKRRRGERWSASIQAARREAAMRFLALIFGHTPRPFSIPRDLARGDYWREVARIAGTRLRGKTVTGNDAAIVALVKDRPRARLCTTETALLDVCRGDHVRDAAGAP